MNKGGRERNALNMLHGRDRRGERGEAADKEQGDGEKRRRQGAGEGEEGRTGLGVLGWGGGMCGEVHAWSSLPAQRKGAGKQAEERSEKERAASPSQGPAGLASQAQQNENLLTTQNC